MKFYVDFDDCLCETGRAFAVLVAELFGKQVPYEEMKYFNLRDSFDLTETQYAELLGHEPELLADLSAAGVKMIRRVLMSDDLTSLTSATDFAERLKRMVPSPGSATL